jgi:hypothetical protein
MAEVTFVGLATLVWMFVVALAIASIGTIVIVVHIIRVEVRHFMCQRRAKRARREMLDRQARARRRAERLAQDEQFFKELEGIFNER